MAGEDDIYWLRKRGKVKCLWFINPVMVTIYTTNFGVKDNFCSTWLTLKIPTAIWISSNIRMFADDTKIWCIIKETDDGLMLQSGDMDSLIKWTDKWLVKFNIKKCKVMHLGHKLNT